MTGNALTDKVTVWLASNLSQSISRPRFQNERTFHVNRSWPSRSNSRSNDGERSTGQSYRPIGLNCVPIDCPYLILECQLSRLFRWKGHDLRGQIQGPLTGNALAAKANVVRLASNVSQSIPHPHFQNEMTFQVKRSWPSRSNSRSNDGERSSGQSYRPIGLRCVSIDSSSPFPGWQDFSGQKVMTFEVKFKVKWRGTL